MQLSTSIGSPTRSFARPSSAQFGDSNKLRLGICFLLILIEVATAIAVHRACTSPAYASLGRLRGALLWALLTNIAAASLVLGFGIFAKWQRTTHALAVITGLSSLPILMIRCHRLSPAAIAQERFGLLYGVLIFGSGLTYCWLAICNARRTTSGRNLRVWILLSSTFIYLSIGAWTNYALWPTSDEPNYLTLTHSLLVDHDLDVNNNFEHRDYLGFYPFDFPEPHTVTGLHGEKLLWHDLGMPLLLVPGYAIGGRLGALLELNLFTACMMLGVFEIALYLTSQIVTSTATWALFALACPVVVYTAQIYPELLGGAFAIGVVVAFVYFERSAGPWLAFAMGMLIAYLPWLCIRFWTIALPLLSVVAVYILVRCGPWGRRALYGSLLVGPLVLGTALFTWIGHSHFGRWLPNGGYMAVAAQQPQFTWRFYWGFLGLMLDRSTGLLPVAPIYILGAAAICIGIRRQFWTTVALVLPCVAYVGFMSFSRYWWAGLCSPGRYVLSGVVLLMPLAALVIDSARAKAAAWALWIFSMLPAFVQTAVPSTRYNVVPDISKSGINQYLLARLDFGYTELFPSFIHQPKDYILGLAWIATIIFGISALIRDHGKSPASSSTGRG